MNPLCRFLTWDSEFFNARIGRLEFSNPSPLQFEEVEVWCFQEHIDCLYFLCEAEDQKTIHLAEKNGFHLMDIRVELEKRISYPKVGTNSISESNIFSIRPYQATDIKALQQGVRFNHMHTRFFRDTNFSQERAEDFYAHWLEKNCNSNQSMVFIAEHLGHPAGYLTCSMEAEIGRIDLAGVNALQRNLGIGTALVIHSLNWFSTRGAERARVVTQGANIPAQRLYTSHGFYPVKTQLWYHKWFDHQSLGK